MPKNRFENLPLEKTMQLLKDDPTLKITDYELKQLHNQLVDTFNNTEKQMIDQGADVNIRSKLRNSKNKIRELLMNRASDVHKLNTGAGLTVPGGTFSKPSGLDSGPDMSKKVNLGKEHMWEKPKSMDVLSDLADPEYDRLFKEQMLAKKPNGLSQDDLNALEEALQKSIRQNNLGDAAEVVGDIAKKGKKLNMFPVLGPLLGLGAAAASKDALSAGLAGAAVIDPTGIADAAYELHRRGIQTPEEKHEQEKMDRNEHLFARGIDNDPFTQMQQLEEADANRKQAQKRDIAKEAVGDSGYPEVRNMAKILGGSPDINPKQADAMLGEQMNHRNDELPSQKYFTDKKSLEDKSRDFRSFMNLLKGQ